MHMITRQLAWAWLIIIGALMFYPGGVECIACGAMLSKFMGVVSILIGVAGFATAGRSAGSPS